MGVNLKALIGKCNSESRAALEAAAGLCLSRTHYDVEIEHYLMKLLDQNEGDFAAIVKHYGIDRSRLAAELTRSLDHLKSGNARNPALSPTLVRMFQHAWTIGSLEFGATQIRTGHTILALLSDEELNRVIRDVSRELPKINADGLKQDFLNITATSHEKDFSASAAGGDGEPAPRGAGGKTPNLDQFTIDLTERARKGKIDPVLGRDFEIRQVVDILTRRRQNNPILVGEAGVGKTAVVEGFALRIAQGDVPQVLKNVNLRMLDLALLQAGAGVKGEFENRLKGLIEEVKSSPAPIILFIDEAHTMIGAGGAAGQNDAANLLKPALARGELRTLAATTWSEYKKYFEKDPALTRRFQMVKVDEPDEKKCSMMLRGIIPALENHHQVRILEEGLEAAVKLSHRYLPDRQLPDKAVSVLDTACARLALGQNVTPGPIEDCHRVLDDVAVQIRVLERESSAGADHSDRLAALASLKSNTEQRLAGLSAQWEKERDLVARIRQIRTQLEAAAHPAPAGESGTAAQPAIDPAALRQELGKLYNELEAVQGESPMMRVAVDANLVGEVISGWTGIPVGKMMTDEVQVALSLEQRLGARVIGQDHALQVISMRIRTSRAGIEDPGKPVGVFLLAGPSGVGKTETALALSELLYGGERNLITINMSEFQEAHTVSTLKGSPPGYVGYGEGGVLTEAVRRRPYSVVLLDEVEKAHPDVLELFFQVFDKGVMEDGEGRQIDFKNTIIILTTNAGTETVMKLTADPETMPSHQGLVKALKPELDKIFKPAFLGRLVIIPYFPVRDEALKRIVLLKLEKIKRRLLETHKIDFSYDDALVEEVARRCTEVESGARNIDNILTNSLLPEISRKLLEHIAEGRKPQGIRTGIGENGEFTYSYS
ncbi:MAG TPA: type VI secretion system ATPase TssH [Bryobacteraceae bacterium]|jgi:type VI secretion system protein VasG|nr:type VI secretion system ATPase TssH [Bryobacteraceae bacterium]